MQFTNRKIIWAIVILQILVCLPFISGHQIALDEPFSIFQAQQNLSEFIPTLNKGNNSPFYFILLHYWMDVFGMSPLAVRSLSLLFSILTIPFLYLLVQKLSNKSIAALVSLLFVFSKFNHFHALEARMYTLFVLLFTLIVYHLYLIIFEQKNRFIPLIIWNVLLLYTHYLGVFVVLVECILLIVFFKQIKPYFKHVLGSILVIFIMFYPALNNMLTRSQDFSSTGSWVPNPHFTELYGNVLRFFNGKISFLVLLGIFIVFVFIFKTSKKVNFKQLLKDRKLWFILLLFGVPYFGMFAFSILVQPVFIDRYLLFTTIPLFILFGYLVYLMLPDLNIYFKLIFLIPLLLTTHYNVNNNRSPDKMVAFVMDERETDQHIYLNPPWIDLMFLYHYDLESFKNYRNLNVKSPVSTIFTLDEVSLKSSFLLVNSTEGLVKAHQEVLHYFEQTHDLLKYEAVNELYHLYHYHIKK